MENRNLDKLKPFIKAYNSGEIIYSNGALYRTVRKLNQFTTIDLEEPELMRSDSVRGYYRVKYSGVSCYEHLVIYAIFNGIDSLSEFECIDHIDADKKNNCISNLEGVSISENNKRAKDNGLLVVKNGVENGNSKLNDDIVREIRDYWNKKEFTITELANKYNVGTTTISNVVNRKRWNHVE